MENNPKTAARPNLKKFPEAKGTSLVSWHCWRWALCIRSTRDLLKQLDIDLDERGT
jgi:hypothetical protein